MIYIDDKLQTEADLKPYVQKLEEVFPQFFKGNGVEIVFSQMLKTEKRQKGTHTVGAPVSVPPRPESIPTIYSQVGSNGIRKFVVYTEEPVTRVEGVMQYGKPKIRIENGMVLRNPIDLEKLIILYFFDERFENSLVAKPSAYLKFVMPNVDARARIEKDKKVAQYKNDILFGGLSIERVHDVMKSLRMTISEDEPLDRTTLYDAVVASAQTENVYNGLLASDGGAKIKDALLVVQKAIECGALAQQDGKWVPIGKNGTGGKAFLEVSATGSENDLAEYLSKNEVEKARLERAIEKASEAVA